MEGEDLSIAPSGPETATAPEATTETTVANEPERIPSPEEALSEQQTEEAPQVEDDSVEIEWDDGNKYRIPKALESGILKNKDYTTKTQETAALRKQLESREVEITQRLKATDEELEYRSQARFIESELERFKDFGWPQYQEALRVDPLAAQEAWAYAQSLREQKAGITEQLNQAQTKRSEAAQQDLAKRFQDTLAAAPKIIPGWTPETADKTLDELLKFATSAGIPEQVLKDNWSPVLLKLIHRAHVGEKSLQSTVPKPASTVVPQPLRTVNGNKSAPTSGDLASLDMEAYVAARKKGVGGKALR